MGNATIDDAIVEIKTMPVPIGRFNQLEGIWRQVRDPLPNRGNIYEEITSPATFPIDYAAFFAALRESKLVAQVSVRRLDSAWERFGVEDLTPANIATISDIAKQNPFKVEFLTLRFRYGDPRKLGVIDLAEHEGTLKSYYLFFPYFPPNSKNGMRKACLQRY